MTLGQLIAFPGGRGTAHMVRIARSAGVQVITVTGDSQLPKPHAPGDKQNG